MMHELKTDPEPFDAVSRGEKTFEIRKDDRGFKVGDTLLLRRTKFTGEQMHFGDPLEYTGEQETFRVTHILRGPVYGLADGWVIMSLGEL
jgi:ASC-1-like (ASCH) protein